MLSILRIRDLKKNRASGQKSDKKSKTFHDSVSINLEWINSPKYFELIYYPQFKYYFENTGY